MLKPVYDSGVTINFIKNVRFSPTELDVLNALVKFDGNRPKVADALFIAPSTLNTHINHIFQKTASNRMETVIIRVLKAGLVDLESCA